MPSEVIIDARFNGPPSSAQGGYAAGTLARFVDGPAEVTLRSPPPLSTPLEIVTGAEGVRMLHEGELVAEAEPIQSVDVEPPVRPFRFDAEAASACHPGRGRQHPFSTCFVCGTEREDGLHVSAGPLPAAPEVGAAPFDPDPSLADEDGIVRPEIIWAVLDCPSYTPRLWQRERLSLLGRFSAELLRPVAVGEKLVVVGWDTGGEGRKSETASALLAEDGELVARARAIWIEPRDPVS